MNFPIFSRWFKVMIVTVALSPCFCLGTLTWDSQQVHLAAKPGDKTAVVSFQFHNTGTTPVTITKVQPSCGCTTAELAKRTYAPGETGVIKATFTFGASEGLQEKHINVTTDEIPDTPVTLILRVDIPRFLDFSPQLLLWRIGEETTEKTSIATAASPHKFKAVEITAVNPPASVVARVEPIEVGVKYRILVRPNSSAKASQVALSCLATFEDKTAKNFTIYVLVR